MPTPGWNSSKTVQRDGGSPDSRGHTPDSEQKGHASQAPNNGHRLTVQHLEESPEGSDRTPSGSEDLFLGLVKDDSVAQDAQGDVKHIEHRKSFTSRRQQVSDALHSSPLTPISIPPGNVAEQYLAAARRERQRHTQFRRTSQYPPSATKFHGQGNDRNSEISPYILEGRQSRHHGLITKPSFAFSGVDGLEKQAKAPFYGKQRDSYQTPPSRSAYYRPSNLSYSATRHFDSVATLDTPPGSTNNGFRGLSPSNGTESVGSMTAASTVWDELDGLKSRIRKLELTGRLPPTSSEAMSQAAADRPRTSSTTLTTISSSPRPQRKHSGSPTEVPVGGPKAAHIHPLLHQALHKAKPLLNGDLYRCLEATANDALTLAAMSGSAGADTTAYKGAAAEEGLTVVDRQLRRKADNMCRSLTELCIALCDGKQTNISVSSPRLTVTPADIDTNLRQSSASDGVSTFQQDRWPSVEPEPTITLRSSPSRALSRIEARRASLHTLSQNRSTTASPRDTAQEGVPQIHLPTSQRAERTAISRLNSHRRSSNEGYGNSSDQAIRAPSRARTEFGNTRPASRDTGRIRRISREYTSQVPLPKSGHQFSSPEGLGSTFALRHETNGLSKAASGGTYGGEGGNGRSFGRGRPESRLYDSPSVVAGSSAFLRA